MELRKKKFAYDAKEKRSRIRLLLMRIIMYRIKKRISVRSSRRKARWRLNRSR